jgi:hypothetical protein
MATNLHLHQAIRSYILGALGNKVGNLLSGLLTSSKGMNENSYFRCPDFSVLLPIGALPGGW